MKKLLIFTIALVLVPYSIAFSQAPRSVMFGGLFHSGGERDFAFAAGTTVPVIENKEVGAKDYIRTGYFYSNATEEVQAVFTMNILEKTIKYLSSGARWYAATGAGFMIEIEDGEDTIDGAFLMESGLQFGETVKLGLGITYEPIAGAPDRTFAYLHLDLFPKLF